MNHYKTQIYDNGEWQHYQRIRSTCVEFAAENALRDAIEDDISKIHSQWNVRAAIEGTDKWSSYVFKAEIMVNLVKP